MNIQGIIKTQFTNCTIERVANEPFVGSIPYGGVHIEHTGTLPAYDDVIAAEQAHNAFIATIKADAAAKQTDIDMLEKGILKVARLTIDLAEVLVANGALSPADFTPEDRANFIKVRDAVNRLK